MALTETLGNIITALRQGRFPNEQAISQGVVLRLLQELGWDAWDTAIVWPEFQTGQGRADFALCHPPSKPAIFVEVKQPGGAENGIRQALEYAFHTGVPFVVLTDGRTWSFYLPAEQGSYEERRVYKLDLNERPPEEAAPILVRYLDYQRVVSGESLEAARKEYRSRNRKSQAKAAIPEAWAELVEKGDELLIELVANAVESKAGIRPDVDDIASYLAGLAKPIFVVQGQPPVQQPKQAGSEKPSLPKDPYAPAKAEPDTPRAGTLVLKGNAYPYRNAKEAMVTTLTILAKSDPNFLTRCSTHPDVQGRKRKYIGRTPAELYPDRPDLHDMVEHLPGGWLVATNLNNQLKKTIIRAATETAGLVFGKDVLVEF
jgi:predicted type IV restriction endonuclease